MTLPRLIYAVLFATACVPTEKSLGQGETGDDGSDGTNDDGGPGSSGATLPDDGATSMVGGTDDGATTSTPGDTSIGGTDDGATTGGPVTTSPTTDSDSGDTGLAVCEIVETACEMAEQSKSPPIDCGDVTFDDPLATWEAAHDCVVSAATVTEAFKLIVDMQGIDSLPRRAFVGQVGVVYQMTQLDQDFGGINPGPTPITYRYCNEIVATPGCTTAVGDICLTCMGDLDGDVLCEP